MSVEAKICGLCRSEDARMADRVGADYLGVVFGTGPRQCTPERARRIWAGLRGRRVGVFVDADPDLVTEVATDLGLWAVQLHGSESPRACRRLREVGGWEVWKAIRIADETTLPTAVERYGEAVDGLLVEGSSGAGQGGVGARFDWSLVAAARASWPPEVRFILAGGLNAENVADAIEASRPDVVDVSSGVEASVCQKDHACVEAFIRAAKGVR